MSQYRVSLSFAQMPDVALDDFATAVIAGLTAQATGFPKPPVDVATLTTLKTTFENAIAATAQGGTSATAAKNTAREALVDGLRKDAMYVEITANNDLAMLLSTGYPTASTNRAQSMLDKVQIVGIENLQTGVLKVRVKTDPAVKSFAGRIKPSASGEFGPTLSFQNSKKILFEGLTAGITYTLQLCAIGGSTGQSDWSDPVSHMAM